MLFKTSKNHLILALLIFNIAEKGCHSSRLATVAVFTTENSCVPPLVDTAALQHLHHQQQLLLCSPRPTAPAVLLGYFIGALYWHYILEKALLLRVLPLHSFLAARLKQHPPTLPNHPPPAISCNGFVALLATNNSKMVSRHQ